jgi:hypothetical protein
VPDSFAGAANAEVETARASAAARVRSCLIEVSRECVDAAPAAAAARLDHGAGRTGKPCAAGAARG